MSKAIEDVLAERERQVVSEGWTPEHDDKHGESELALAAASYAMAAGGYPKGRIPPVWPWALEWWKPKSQRGDLVRAAALLIAEIERLDRAAQHQSIAQCPDCGRTRLIGGTHKGNNGLSCYGLKTD